MRTTKLVLALSLAFAADAAVASPQRPTLTEYRAWTKNGAYYEYICDVTGERGASLRSAPSGLRLRALPNTTKFLMIRAAAYDKVHRIWYRLDQFAPRISGWVLATEVSCRTEHMDG